MNESIQLVAFIFCAVAISWSLLQMILTLNEESVVRFCAYSFSLVLWLFALTLVVRGPV